ncbi:MAG: hypothetical protein ACPGOV_05120 [Magnetovibrionaceae bacterium]
MLPNTARSILFLYAKGEPTARTIAFKVGKIFQRLGRQALTLFAPKKP